MSAIPKPVLRGHLKRYIAKSLIGAFALAACNCSAFYFLVMEPRKKAYAEFARTYDSEKHFQLLKKYGYLQSV